MKIAICGSLKFTNEFKKISDELEDLGFEVEIPLSSRRIWNGDFSVEEIEKEKAEGSFHKKAIRFDSFRAYWDIIQNADAILVVNLDKNNIKNYIGGNTFLEMGFAHILKKKIFLLNEIPEMLYSEEIKVMQPVVLGGDLEKII
ncbi:MAG: hypothetical protein WC178_00750 [Candidatus Paceibacterota bacterium]